MSCEKKKIKLGLRHLLARGNTISDGTVRKIGKEIVRAILLARVSLAKPQPRALSKENSR